MCFKSVYRPPRGNRWDKAAYYVVFSSIVANVLYLNEVTPIIDM